MQPTQLPALDTGGGIEILKSKEQILDEEISYKN